MRFWNPTLTISQYTSLSARRALYSHAFAASVIVATAVTAVTVAAGLGAWGLRRRQGWHWWAQGAFLVAVLVSYFISIQMLSGQ